MFTSTEAFDTIGVDYADSRLEVSGVTTHIPTSNGSSFRLARRQSGCAGPAVPVGIRRIYTALLLDTWRGNARDTRCRLLHWSTRHTSGWSISSEFHWQDRAHFFAVAARVMRRILVDSARARRYQKRGGGAENVSLDEALLVTRQHGPDLVALDDALSRAERLWTSERAASWNCGSLAG